MAKFLNTSGVSYHLEELIKGTEDRLILISPYLQFSDRIKEHLTHLNSQKRDIRIVYRENKLQLDVNNWLDKQIGIRTSLCKNLHAKCYINEKEAIITSMNLYQFSQQNNNEMGIYISKEQDTDLYKATYDEVQRLLSKSEEVRLSMRKITSDAPPKTEKKTVEVKASTYIPLGEQAGFCIRTGVLIPFNIEKPMSYEAFKSWNKYGDPDYSEKFCHFSGEPSDGETSVSRPILRKYWKKAKGIFG